MQLKNGKFTVEVDIQDFDLEDIDIKVEGASLILNGKGRAGEETFASLLKEFPSPPASMCPSWERS